MLPDVLKPVFLKFFSEVDRFVSKEVTQTKGRTGETATTGRLLRCLHLSEKMEPPDGLRFTPQQFRDELARAAEDIPGHRDVGFEIKAEGFSQIYEGRVTQADYTVRLSYQDTSEKLNDARSASWDAFYFFQAKIARTRGSEETIDDHVWAGNAVFGDTDGQDAAVKSVRNFVGDGLLYNLYCPSDALQLVPDAHVYQRLLGDLSERPAEWAQAESAGLWVARNLPSTLAELLHSNDDLTRPWALFLMDHYFVRDADDAWSPDVMYHAQSYLDDDELMIRNLLFDRNSDIIARIQNQLVDEGVRDKIERMSLFAKHSHRPTINITIKFPGFDYIHTPRSQPPGP